jgi:hypothetical protein
MQELLDVCDDWSKNNGITFAPSKTVVLSRTQVNISLYNTQLQCEERFTYLGIIFDVSGIRWDLNAIKRAQKAAQLVRFFQSKGFNGLGWRPNSCLQVYKQFIRPTMEYGLALAPLDKNCTNTLQKVQNLALRTMFSVASSTSVDGLHRLTCLPSMKERNHELNVRYMGRLHNRNDKLVPAIRMYWSLLQTNPLPEQSLYRLLKKNNPYFTQADLINHVFNRLEVQGTIYQEPLPTKTRMRLRYEDVIDLKKKSPPTQHLNVAESIPVN